MALSTLKPATSPRLSIIRLDFCANRDVETVVTEIGGDLRRIADEVARIEREFKGAVNFTVNPDSTVRLVLVTLNVRFNFTGWKKPCGHVRSSSFVPCRSFSVTSVELGRLSLPLASRRLSSSFFCPVSCVWCGCIHVPSLWIAQRGTRTCSNSLQRESPSTDAWEQ